LPLLSTTCILLAAKLEQPISPSFSRMITLLSEEERASVTKQQIADLEAHILITFGFDLNFPNPINPMERFLRILNYDQNRIVCDMSFQIMKFQLNDSVFLNYRPSMIAACSVILAINIYEHDMISASNNKKFFNNFDFKDNIGELNLEIWNNLKVHSYTGFSILDI